MLIKQKRLSLHRNLALGTFGEVPKVLSNSGKSAIHTLFNNPKVFSSASDKAKLFAKIFSKNLILMTRLSFYLISFLERI